MTAGLAGERIDAAEPSGRLRLAALLDRAAGGDLDAFMRFYDATVDSAYRLVLCRSRDAVAAEEATAALYVTAWVRVADYARSGLSPLAWLLGLRLAGPLTVGPGPAAPVPPSRRFRRG